MSVLSQYLEDAIEPDFLGRYAMNTEGAYNNACMLIDTLKSQMNNMSL